jgi:acyl-CoA thioesterase-2
MKKARPFGTTGACTHPAACPNSADISTNVDTVLSDIVELLRLERLEKNLFRGKSRDIGSERVFGGQVLGQALVAATATVDGRSAHSLHGYFLRPGDVSAPIVYHVDRSRDGGSFTSRRVVAIQHGEQIFHMAASFQTPEVGLEHQVAMPQVPPPESLRRIDDIDETLLARAPEKLRRVIENARPFDTRPVDPIDPLQVQTRPPKREIWVRTAERVGDDEGLHRALLAYFSDYHFISTAMLPHGLSSLSSGVQVASLDHAMWFHRPFRVDEWLLLAYESPTASGGRGFARGSIFSHDGRLVASTAQEGLIRVRRK